MYEVWYSPSGSDLRLVGQTVERDHALVFARGLVEYVVREHTDEEDVTHINNAMTGYGCAKVVGNPSYHNDSLAARLYGKVDDLIAALTLFTEEV